MDTRQIKEAYESAFNKQELVKVKKPDRRLQQHEYKVFYLRNIAELSDEVRQQSLSDKQYDETHVDFLQNYAARFVVATDNKILFCLEGPRSKKVPAHSDIAERLVLTAGNIHFSEDYSSIVAISNKSGHFEPSFASLVFAIPLILNAGFPLASVVNLLDEFNNRKCSVQSDQLMDLIPARYPLSASMNQNRDSGVIEDLHIFESAGRDNAALGSATMFAAAAAAASVSNQSEQDGCRMPDPNENFFKRPRNSY